MTDLTVMAKTSRFKTVVESAGKPTVHLPLTDPEKDQTLRRADKANRVMMVHQTTVGTAKDFGTVGFDPEVTGEILIFPRSLKTFAGSRVVGIDYDLINEEKATKKAPLKKAKPHKPRKTAEAKKPTKEKAPKPQESATVAELQRGIRRALKMLEQGKQVPAFNVLKDLLQPR